MSDPDSVSAEDVDAPDNWIVEEDGGKAVYVYESRTANESEVSMEASNHSGDGWTASLYLPPEGGGLHDLVDFKSYSSPQEAGAAVSRVARAFEEGRLSCEDCITSENVFKKVAGTKE